jgi:hypothetical protein
MSALLTILVIAAASAETATDTMILDDGERRIELSSSASIVDEGETFLGTVVSDDDPSIEGELVWSPETGRLFAQGSSDDGGWVVDAQCKAFGEGYLCAADWGRIGDPTWGRITESACIGVVSGTSMACPNAVDGQSGQALAYWQPSKTGAEPAFLTVGGQSFKCEVNGQFLPIKSVMSASNTYLDDVMQLEFTLQGFYDTETDTMRLSWLGEAGVVLMESACELDGDTVVCDGAALMWDGAYGDGHAPSFWGYEHMTTVKGL